MSARSDSRLWLMYAFIALRKYRAKADGTAAALSKAPATASQGGACLRQEALRRAQAARLGRASCKQTTSGFWYALCTICGMFSARGGSESTGSHAGIGGLCPL